MKAQNYKATIFGNQIYQEIELHGENAEGVMIGTTKACRIRFNRDHFFDDFEIELLLIQDGWKIMCNDSIYIVTEGIIKQYSVELKHGDELTFKYQSSNSEVFKITFLINFDRLENNFDRVIDLSSGEMITIGGASSCDVYIQDELLGNDYIQLLRQAEGYFLQDYNSKYGIYVNGFKMGGSSKAIQDFDFFMLGGYSFYIKYNKLYTAVKDNIKVSKFAYVDHKEQNNRLTYPKFNRNTRIYRVLPEEKIEILSPKPKPDKKRKNIILTFAPAIISFGLMIALRGMMRGGGGSFIIYSAAIMGMGIITSVVTYISDIREEKKEKIKRREQYIEYITEEEDRICELRKKEFAILEDKYISIEDDIKEAMEFDRRLFEKDKEDDDYLCIRIGKGSVEANCEITYRKQDFADKEDDLLEFPKKIADAYKRIEDAPITIALKKIDSVGVIGEREELYEMLKNMTIDLAVRHYYNDVKFYFIFAEQDYGLFTWLRWFENVKNGESPVRNFMYDEESKKIVLEYLYAELSGREAADEKEIALLPHYIVFVYDSSGLSKHPVSKYVENCKRFGFTFLFFEEVEEFLPKGCDYVLYMKNKVQEGILLNAHNKEDAVLFRYTQVPNRVAENVSLRLGCVYADEVSLESNLTKNISLFKLLDIMNVDDLDIGLRWRESKVYESMAAPLGVRSNNTIVDLNLNEKSHGPHGLVAGTTGSGKSEILQSYILSMATLFHPYEIGFVIIDFKGGGMVNQFKELPHLVGAITNIDGREVDRSLLSIKAELRKRQELFAQYNVNHIDAYIKKFKARETTIALPHLILVVDEFAELKSDQPEFMKELISAARIGRSLGVHLILATQKPSGVVDDQIWSNSKFKLCLKVQNKSDSNEVLKSPLAAEIKEPGRAYLQVGNNEIFELFQSAYSGAPANVDQIGSKKEFEIYKVNLVGKREIIYQQKNKKSKESISQLEALVQYIAGYCETEEIIRLPGICLPPLETVIQYSQKQQLLETENKCVVALGIYDDPSQQLQDEVSANLMVENVFVLGSSQYGKTNVLQTIIRNLAENYSPKEVTIYLLDFASMILKSFYSLNHVGGVVTASEDEKMKNFIKMIKEELIYRKDILSELGLSSYASYKEANYKDLPQIVIMIDNFVAFKELYAEYDESMLNICREGLAVGISVVMANSQTTGIGYKYMSNFARRIALFCNDSGEYSNLFDRCRMQPRNVAGRALIEIDRVIYEYQNYLGFDGEKEIDRVNNMKAMIEEVNQKYPKMRAKNIPEVPTVVDTEYIQNNYNMKTDKSYNVPIGIDYNSVEVQTINLLKTGVLSISGKEKSGRTNFLAIIFEHLQKNVFTHPVKAYIIDNMDRQLKPFDAYGFVEKYSIDLNDIEEILSGFLEIMEHRYLSYVDGSMEVLEKEPLLLLVVHNKEVFEKLSANKAAMDTYKQLIAKYKALKMCIVFAEVANAAIAYNSPELLKIVKEGKNMLIFEDLQNQKIYDVSLSISKTFKKKITVGDAYYIKDSEIFKIKTVKSKGK